MAIQQGMNQQTAAVQSTIRSAMGSVRRAVKRRVVSTVKRAASSVSRKVSRKGKIKFGSPAWQKKYKIGKYRK